MRHLGTAAPQSVGGGFGSDHLQEGEVLFGSSHPDRLAGTGQGDQLSGGQADDTLLGRGGERFLSATTVTTSWKAGTDADQLFGDSSEDFGG